jgi:hypothetical protein
MEDINKEKKIKNEIEYDYIYLKINHRNNIFVKIEIDLNNIPDLQRIHSKSHTIASWEIEER